MRQALPCKIIYYLLFIIYITYLCHNYKGFSIHLGKPTTFLRTDWSPSPPGPPPPLPRLLSSCSQSHHNRPRRCAAAAIVATAVAANSAAAVAAAAARTSFNFQIEKMCRNSSPSLLKGQSNEISDLQFFSSFEPAWANIYRFWFSFRRVIQIVRGIIPQWGNLPSSMILRWVNLPAVSYCGESCDLPGSYLKGQSKEIFNLYFHNSSPAGPLSNGLRCFRFLWRFRRVGKMFRKNLLTKAIS